MVLFFGLVFSIAATPGNFSLDYNEILNCIHELKEIIVNNCSSFYHATCDVTSSLLV